ncbi:MAG TPA: succinate dehydrogenase iron-sulfur subunit [Armatimonadota bacterium]|jgi:succinate dehydrogenase / fumarate reductase iron-sulfur subunit|nr:succinate dehydrogenase iron-sulfur subunit [Armatimonadota bacterium]HOM80528.1 succinate dehydrogenase iron-sulfur subunit [Armatimonadota bacterium]HPO71427.1 succinate dehydrogenase iron-sulfur subunit [Armatimonadota bacterium]HPT96901.1 succinate dehydrogenase iron-sulfur subunit [Armatimonadota bacterium]
MRYTIRIRRFNPEVDQRPRWQEFTVEMEPTDRLLDALQEIKEHQDETLAFRRSCAHGICGSDAMIINGINRLACKMLLKDLGPRITVEPLRGFKVLRDLIVDMDSFFEQYRSIKPYLIKGGEPPATEYRQTPAERAVYDDTTKCILCAACTTSCPIFWANQTFVGPAALVNAHRFIFDSRDEGAEERLEIVNKRMGVWRCRTIFNCTDACPRGIGVTKAIEDLKRALLYKKL